MKGQYMARFHGFFLYFHQYKTNTAQTHLKYKMLLNLTEKRKENIKTYFSKKNISISIVLFKRPSYLS